MAITPLPETTPKGVVAEACAGLDSLADTIWAARTDDDLVGGVEELQVLKAKTAAVEAELLAELDARETPRKGLHWGSTADWFTHLAGTSRRTGKRTVVHAKQLTGQRRATLAELWAGAVSPDQAHVIIDAVGRLPKAEHVRRRGEQVLLEQAGTLNATELCRAGRHLASVVDPDREERQAEKALDREDRAAHLDRFLTISEDGIGGVRVKGRGSVEDAAVLRKALLPLTKPEPKADTGAGAGTETETGSCEAEEDPRDHGARMWDALIQLAQHALDTKLPPESHGARPQVSVIIDHHTLAATDHHGTDHDGTDHDGNDDWPGQQGTAGVGVTDDGLDLPGSAVRRMACDCDLIRVLLDADGCVLDVGRSQRLVTPAIWTALVARDRRPCASRTASHATQPCRARSARGRRCALKQTPLAAAANGAAPSPPHTVAGAARRRRPTRVPATTQTRPIPAGLDPTPATARVAAGQSNPPCPAHSCAARSAARVMSCASSGCSGTRERDVGPR